MNLDINLIANIMIAIILANLVSGFLFGRSATTQGQSARPDSKDKSAYTKPDSEKQSSSH